MVILKEFKLKLTFIYDLTEPHLSLITGLFSEMQRGEFDLELTRELIDLNDPHLDPLIDPLIDDVGVSKL